MLDKYSLRINHIISLTLMKRDCQLNICHKPPRIVTGFQNKAQGITGDKSKTTTVIGGGTGVGKQIPLFFVFARRTA